MVEVLDALNVNYRPDLNILFCRFVQPIPSAQLKSSYEYALQVAQEKQVHFWLFDLRRRGPARQEDEDWILEKYFPRLETHRHLPNYVAYLVTPTHFAHIREKIGMDKLQNYSSLTYIQIFDSEEKALNWLTNNQTINV